MTKIHKETVNSNLVNKRINMHKETKCHIFDVSCVDSYRITVGRRDIKLNIMFIDLSSSLLRIDLAVDALALRTSCVVINLASEERVK